MKKGILKPIRYISQIFDQKEPELQIGFPTDVKHVAHIGWDGPNVEDPGWMKDYHSAPINPTPGSPEKESATSDDWGSQGADFLSRGAEESPAGDGGSGSTRPRHSRRPKSDETPAVSGAEVADGGTKKGRKGRKKDAAATQDAPAIPKHSHRRRPKDGGGSATSSKSKATPSSNPGGAAELGKTAAEPS
ncbi:CRIB domain-containing protein RIC5-like [Curcuma longa]|uniref:CRIB domain-containing protein RIC5-like n=1 Tax=Curcuma longa TaxID=136217 RepID=UPI003D9E2F01